MSYLSPSPTNTNYEFATHLGGCYTFNTNNNWSIPNMTKAETSRQQGVQTMKHHLEFNDGKSAKFWQVTVDGDTVTTQWGKIGTTGQSKTKSYDSPEAAEKDALKQKNAKLKKGYEEASSDNSGIAKTATVAHAKKAAAAPKKPIQEAIDPSSAPKAKLIAWCKAEGRTSTELEQALGRFPESDRAIASRDDCPSHILSELSHSSDKTTRSKVASNPKTLRDDFIRLGQLFTKEFLQNPLLDVLLLEDPGLLESLPHTLLTRIAKNEECPTPFLVWAASHSEEKVQLAVAMNHATPKEAIDVLRASSFEKVKNSLPIDYVIEGSPREAFETAVKIALEQLTFDEVFDALFEGKKHLGLPQFSSLSLQGKLGAMGDVYADDLCCLRVSLLYREDLAHELLTLIVSQLVDSQLISAPSARHALLNQKNVSTEIKRGLGRPENYVRSFVKPHETEYKSMHDIVAETDLTLTEGEVRKRYGGSKYTPEARTYARNCKIIASSYSLNTEQISQLRSHYSPEVRARTAINPTIPLETLKLLGKDEHPTVRRYLGANRCLSSELMEQLINSEHELAQASLEEIRTGVIHPFLKEA